VFLREIRGQGNSWTGRDGIPHYKCLYAHLLNYKLSNTNFLIRVPS